MPSYPQSDKLMPQSVTDIYQFLEWLEENGYGVVSEESDVPSGLFMTSDELVFEYVGVDKAALETERRAMLKTLR